MSVTVKIPAQLRSSTDGKAEVLADGETIGKVLESLYSQHADLRDRITEDGDLRRFVNIYKGGEDIRFMDGLDTAIADGEEITILPAVAGG